MTPQWGYKASLSTLLLWLFLSSGVCVEHFMDNAHLCGGHKVNWLSDSTIITGRHNSANDKNIAECKLLFGPASQKGEARLRLKFDFLYFHDCGVKLRINESSSSKFDVPENNNEMFMSGCYEKNPGILYAQPKNYVILHLFKTDRMLNSFNFHLNISVADKLPSSGPPMHVIIIVSFVCTVVVITAAFLLLKYTIRMSYRWSEERTEEAMTRAINLYNSSEPLEEEPEMVYIRPGESAASSSGGSGSGSGSRVGRAKPNRPEIAFVHADGRIERFRPLQGQWAMEPATNDVQVRPKRQKCRVTDSPTSTCTKALGTDARDKPARYPVRHGQPMFREEQPNLVDISETASLCGIDMPPSYEEALDMPMPKDDDGGDQEEVDPLSEAGAVGGADIPVDSGPRDRTQSPSTRCPEESADVEDTHPRKTSPQDVEDLARDSANYMNVGGRLEMLDGDSEDGHKTDDNSRHPSEQPLLPGSPSK